MRLLGWLIVSDVVYVVGLVCLLRLFLSETIDVRGADSVWFCPVHLGIGTLVLLLILVRAVVVPFWLAKVFYFFVVYPVALLITVKRFFGWRLR